MAELVVDYVIKKDEFVRNANCPFSSARCIHRHCPSYIRINNTNIDGETCYYLSHIPHFHDTPIYRDNPDHLPLFLQHVLYYYSGHEYCKQLAQQLSSSSSSILMHILEEKRVLFTENCKDLLRQAAMDELVNSLNVAMDFAGPIDGKYLN